jgi:ABC-type sugar transport system permease subunit
MISTRHTEPNSLSPSSGSGPRQGLRPGTSPLEAPPGAVKEPAPASSSISTTRRNATAFLFLLPAVAILVAFVAVPVFDAVLMSFQKVSLAGERTFVGFDNFRLLAQSRFLNNLRYSLIYLIGVLALSIPLGYWAALLITSGGQAANFFRTFFLLPWIMTTVVTALIFRSLVDPVTGPVAALLSRLTGEPQYFLIDPGLAMLTLVLHAAWRSFPLVMLFLAAGIAAIPREIYDAASLDGASGYRLFRHVTLPLTQTQLFITALVITAFTLQDAEGVFALTGGGPGHRTEVLAVRLMQEAFRNLNLGLGAAISMALLALGFIIMAVYLRLIKEESA